MQQRESGALIEVSTESAKNCMKGERLYREGQKNITFKTDHAAPSSIMCFLRGRGILQSNFMGGFMPPLFSMFIIRQAPNHGWTTYAGKCSRSYEDQLPIALVRCPCR